MSLYGKKYCVTYRGSIRNKRTLFEIRRCFTCSLASASDVILVLALSHNMRKRIAERVKETEISVVSVIVRNRSLFIYRVIDYAF